VSNSSFFTPALLRTHSFVFFAVDETRRIFLSPFISNASRRTSSFFLRVQLSQPYVATGHASYSTVLSKNGRQQIGANGVSWPPWNNGWETEKRKHTKKSSFLCSCYILIAIRADRCRERRYADHLFIQIYFRMHHLVVRFSKFSSPQAAKGHWSPLPKSCGRSCSTLLLEKAFRTPNVKWLHLTGDDISVRLRVKFSQDLT